MSQAGRTPDRSGSVARTTQLTDEQLAEVEVLERACVDDGQLKLEWPTLRTRRPSGEFRDFLYTEDATPPTAGTAAASVPPLGFLGLYNFGPGPTEICGMVHPRARRQGIFSSLLRVASESPLEAEVVRPDGTVMRLFVVNRSSLSGGAFALAMNSRLEHSEYQMNLRRDADPPLFRRYEDLLVRPTVESDSTVLAEVLRSAFGAAEGGGLEDMDVSGLTTIEWRGEVVGMIRAYVDAKGGSISGFAIAQAHRGKGLGHQVLSEIVRDLRRRGVENVSLDVATDNERALNLYLDVGFEQVGATDYFAYTFTPGTSPGAPV